MSKPVPGLDKDNISWRLVISLKNVFIYLYYLFIFKMRSFAEFRAFERLLGPALTTIFYITAPLHFKYISFPKNYPKRQFKKKTKLN